MITLHLNWLNYLTKRKWFVHWLNKKNIQLYAVWRRHSLGSKVQIGKYNHESKRMGKDIQTHSSQKRTGVAIPRSDKMNITNTVTRDKEEHLSW